MRFVRFEIENFKEIKNTVLDLSNIPSANIFTLVGLNESGKTTILEAINSFSPDEAGVETLYRDVIRKIRVQDLVPKNKKANFTGRINVRATLTLDDSDKLRIEKFCRDTINCSVDLSELNEIGIARVHQFKELRV